MQNKYKLNSNFCYQSKENIAFWWFAIIAIVVAFVGIINIYQGNFRLDQYATTIFATTAGIVGTMFGLTAASYAFIWGDLRSDSQENRHLGRVLECYSRKLWMLFVCSLILTVSVIFISLIGLTLAQNITNPSLFKTIYEGKAFSSEYKNEKFCIISVVALLNLIFSAIDVSTMAWMNWAVFRRNEQYAIIAEAILEYITKKYDMQLPEKGSENSASIEYEKIHSLEVLIERILKNHESIGNAFAESQRREKLLTAIITNELRATYNVDSKIGDNDIRKKTEWAHLKEEKKTSRWEQCYKKACEEYELLKKKDIHNFKGDSSIPKPCDCSFIAVYDDLLLYRDNSLVWEEKHKTKNGIWKKRRIGQDEIINIFERRALRYTIKKRLLIFYLRGEMFSNMDLSGISFSGADLRFAIFSNCNLTGIRLKGANCEGADFTRSKMTGMYFEDAPVSESDEIGEIQLSCIDRNLCQAEIEHAWNPYSSREATYLQNATFKEADVSRAYLKALGELEGKQDFPFCNSKPNSWRLGNEQTVFSMIGTNFDYAKMFFSYFKNIDFTNSSLEKAQMYNIGMIQTKATSANFSGAILTNACLAWCDFENADFSKASLAETVLVRVNFSGSNMINANFSYSNIIACNFEGASCQNASFKNVIQDRTELKKQNPKALQGIDLGESRGLRFCFTTLTNTDFSGAKLDKAYFFNAIGQNSIFTKVTGNAVIFENSMMNSSVFNTTRFESGNFKNTVLRNAIFAASQFINCVFDKVDLSETLFTGSQEPCFLGGYMFECDFSNAKGLTPLCFSHICLKGVDFRKTGIREEEFSCNVKLIGCIF